MPDAYKGIDKLADIKDFTSWKRLVLAHFSEKSADRLAALVEGPIAAPAAGVAELPERRAARRDCALPHARRSKSIPAGAFLGGYAGCNLPQRPTECTN